VLEPRGRVVELEAPPRGFVGLSSIEVAARLARFGANEVSRDERFGTLRQLVGTLVSPLTLILLGATALAAFVGETTDAVIIAVTVLLGAALDALQTIRSHASLEHLQQRAVPNATVHRDGQWMSVARATLVPGDLVHLSAGDVVPADARLVYARDLHVQQAALTGESLPAEKDAPDGRDDGAPLASELRDPHLRYAVFLGTSVVSGVGVAVVTATGARTAFGQLAARLREPPPPTELERGLRRFGGLLAKTVVLLVAFLVLVSVALHRDPVESLLFAVALAVGVVPEFMPVVTSITLATGATRMARKHVIVKHLAAIHNFGSIDVLCSDKTGTLTEGTMRLESAVDRDGTASDAVRRLAGAAAHFQTGNQNPHDDAIGAAVPRPEGWTKLDEVPFDFQRRRMSVVVRTPDGVRLIAKGAPEAVLAACTHLRDGAGAARPLDDADRATVIATVRRFGDRGLRTIAMGTRELPARDRYARGDEEALTFEGWLTFLDPPLADTALTMRALAADGVTLKVLTGDDPAVATYICAKTGVDTVHRITGAELDAVSDAALGPLAERTSLFARVSPEQKLRIIRALKERGHVVGYVGDGINDAPSLHTADVGIAAAGAVDVAKDAADIVLLDRGLAVLHAGILEGRQAFGNVMKYMLMATSSNFGNMFSMAVASLAVPFLPMLPTQILLNNFLYDFSQIAIPSDRVDDAYLRKPHHWDMRTLRAFMIRIGLVSSAFDILTFVALLAGFHAAPAAFRTGWFIESLMTQTLVLLVLRTTENPLRNRPSAALGATIFGALFVGFVIPHSPIGPAFGFAPLSRGFLLFVVVTTVAYLTTVEFVKRRLMARLID
jgi:Mg2+-importing ATPase